MSRPHEDLRNVPDPIRVLCVWIDRSGGRLIGRTPRIGTDDAPATTLLDRTLGEIPRLA